jgi:hypothetical protein
LFFLYQKFMHFSFDHFSFDPFSFDLTKWYCQYQQTDSDTENY